MKRQSAPNLKGGRIDNPDFNDPNLRKKGWWKNRVLKFLWGEDKPRPARPENMTAREAAEAKREHRRARNLANSRRHV